jgi:acylphosphatase
VDKAVSIRVIGRVQGVAFRWYAAEEAQRLGVLGWIRNEPDDSVTGHFEGPEDAVDTLIAWCGHGPPSASVRQVAVTEARVTGAADFTIRY